jgi:hypothetical protein
VIRRIRDLVRELRGDRRHPAPQQETGWGIVQAFVGVPCFFGEDCAYPGLGWRCGHRRAHRYKVTVSLGLDHAIKPDFIKDEMQAIAYAAEMAAMKCLAVRRRRG